MDNISNIIVAVAAVVGAIVAALIGGITIWTFRDIRSRSRDILVQILATVVVAVVPVAGIVVYFMLRPRETLQEGYVRALEEESLLASIEHQEFCPTCGRRVDTDMQFCPSCHTKLRNPCGNCGRAVHLSWEQCPYCGNELIPEMPSVNVRRTMKPQVASPSAMPKMAPKPVSSRPDAARVAAPRTAAPRMAAPRTAATLPNSEAAKAKLGSLLDRVGGAIDSVASKAQQRMTTPNGSNGSNIGDEVDDGFIEPKPLRPLPAKQPVNGSTASPSATNGSPSAASFRRPPPNTPRPLEEDELE